MAIEVFNRIEHKYIIDTVTYRKVLEAMAPHMTPDRYNGNLRPYTIANIYYDTPDDYLIRNSLSKSAYKEKLRLRSYGLPTLDTEVFLEIKKKVGGIVNKRRTPIRLSDAYAFIATGAPPTSSKHLNEQVVNEISYFLTFYSLCPKLYLAYDRVAFFEKCNPDLRVSFDHNIRSRRYDVALEKGDHGTPLLACGTCLMEIKTSLAKPLWLSHLLTELQIRRTSFSKYGTEFQRTIKTELFPEKKAI